MATTIQRTIEMVAFFAESVALHHRYILIVACLLSSCMHTGEKSQPAIVGGLEFSGLSAVGVLKSKTMRCTATVISPTRILTAAHCLNGVVQASELTFSLGPSASRPQQSFAVKAFWIHPHYERLLYLNDIALAETQDPIPSSFGAIPIVAEASQGWENRQVFVVGYGYSDGVGKKGSGTKRAVWLPVSKIHRDKFVSLPGDGRSTCGGDSGGPALIKGKRGEPEWSLVGVTVFGQDTSCRQDSIFTRVEAYKNFIAHPELEKDPDNVLNPQSMSCLALKNSKLESSCSTDGITLSPSGNYLIRCRVTPWDLAFIAENCREKNPNSTCLEGVGCSE